MSKQAKAAYRRTGLQKLLVAVIALAVITVIAKHFIYEPAKEKIAYYMAEKFIQAEISSDTELSEDIDAEEIMDSMNEEDRALLGQIISNNFSPGAVSDVTSYLTGGDIEGLKNYAKNTLSDAELQQIRDLYVKYKDQILQNIGQNQT